MNTYSYVLNNPLFWIDKYGLEEGQTQAGIIQILLPASTAPLSKNPIGESVDAQIRYANIVNQSRVLTIQTVSVPFELGIGGPVGSVAAGSCKAFVKKNVNMKNIRRTACAAGFAAACTQGKLNQLDNIADHVQTVRGVAQSSRLPQQTTLLPK